MRGATPTEAARRIGVTRDVLLAWERRYGFPKPERLPNGTRRYRDEVIDALRQVPVWRDEGVPLSNALERARSEAMDAWETREAPPGLSASLLTEILDRLDLSVIVMGGARFRIELANRAHQRLYPGRDLVGQPALDVLTHSSQYFDMKGAFEQVAQTGETLRWAEQLVPLYGEDRWWDFSYGRLSVTADQPVRLLLLARDVTDQVNARREAHALAEEANRVASEATQQAAAFDALSRIVEDVAEHGESSDPEVLHIIRTALDADGVSSWHLEEGAWRRIAAIGGRGMQLPGSEHDVELPGAHPVIAEAIEQQRVKELSLEELWGEDDPDSGHAFVVPVSHRMNEQSVSMLLVEAPARRLSDVGRRFLRSVSQVLSLAPRR